MFKGATSFNQNLCSWGEKFPYDRSDGIFEDSGCTIKDDPTQNQQGPFCASDCTGIENEDGDSGEEAVDVNEVIDNAVVTEEPVDEVVDTITSATEPAVLTTPESVSATEPAIITTPESVDATEPAIVTTTEPAVDTKPADGSNFPPPPAPGATDTSSASLHSNGGLIVVSMAFGLVLSFFV